MNRSPSPATGSSCRPQVRDPELRARQELVADDAIAVDGKKRARGIVRRGRRDLVVQRKRPDRPRRKEEQRPAIGLRLRVDRRDAAATDQGKCTTTSCGPRRRHTVIIVVPSVAHQTILVLDFGSQYTQLIARRLRELSVYSEVWAPDTPLETIRARKPAGIILSGGPKSVSELGAPKCDPGVYDIGSPVLGICYGMQLMAQNLGGRVDPAPQREYGHRGRSKRHPAGLRAKRQRREGGRPRRAVRRRPRGNPGVGESRRFRLGGPRRVRGGGDERERAGGRDVGSVAAVVRDSVSPGSRSHRTRPRDSAELRLRDLRLHRRLDDGVVRRGGDGADPRASRVRPCGVRAQRRRRFHRRRADPSSRGRRSTDVYFRRQRRAAARRGRADSQALRAAAAAAGLR